MTTASSTSPAEAGFDVEGNAKPSDADIIDQLAAVFGGEAAKPTELFVQDWRREPFTSPPGYRWSRNDRFVIESYPNRIGWELVAGPDRVPAGRGDIGDATSPTASTHPSMR